MSGTPSLATVVAGLVDLLADGELRPGYQTAIQRGSAHGTVAVVLSPRHRTRLLVISLEIMRTPKTATDQFLWRLLELNRTLQGRAAFSVGDGGIVTLQAGRPLEDLDEGELVELIIWTANQADRLDDVLLDEFGRENAL